MIALEQVQPLSLDISTGQLGGDPEQVAALQSPKTPEYGIPEDDLRNQISTLAQKGVPLERMEKLIELHDGITNKEAAKSLAGSMYKDQNML